jgi:hypothetical protein
MVNSIVKALNDRFDAEGYAHVTMKDKDNTVVTIKRYDDWDCNGSTEYEVSWGFNGSYGKFCDTIEQVAELLLNFEEVQTKQAQQKAALLDNIMELQLMEEGTKKATQDEIDSLRSFVSDYSKDFYHFRYRGHCEKREWF